MPGERDIVKNLKLALSIEGASELGRILGDITEKLGKMEETMVAAGRSISDIEEVVSRLNALEERRVEAVKAGVWNSQLQREILSETLEIMSKYSGVFRELEVATGGTSQALARIKGQLKEGRNILGEWRDIWNRMASALGFLTVPTSLIDMGRRLIEFTEGLNRSIYGIRELMAVSGAGPM